MFFSCECCVLSDAGVPACRGVLLSVVFLSVNANPGKGRPCPQSDRSATGESKSTGKGG